MAGQFAHQPVDSSSLPGGIPYIVSNEAAERFSFYGMKAILVIFMTTHLLAGDGTLATLLTPWLLAAFGAWATCWSVPLMSSFWMRQETVA